MKKKNSIMLEHDIEYKKIPAIGISSILAIIAVLFFIGLSAYYKYFMGKETLTCTKSDKINLIGYDTPYKVNYKFSFKNKVYKSGKVEEVYDLSKHSDESFEIVKKENLCGKLTSIKDKIYKFENSNCKMEIQERKVIINSNYDIKTDTGEVKINNIKKTFENNGFKCTIDK